ncbi:MAG: hypothetical protein AVDCRST_MAG45-1005 [uncultured Solirubrobacterales bacterium]|uniref:Nitroreductase family deazaflavin-dependent oxidoreductase n=1 Tax=uncultured Solirubrobacterales bacterium TaxID=768556 RepID=A0A6J4SKZ7_9ACTN|nr:MAG: hypothetical protein AVDCRST_MAG45-1005 [uncultured Solirubrobacterales bacterium]
MLASPRRWWRSSRPRGAGQAFRARTPRGNGLDGDTFWIVAEHGRRAAYVRNLEVDPRVRVKVGRRWRVGTAEPLPEDDPSELQRQIGRRLNALVVRAMGTDLLTVRVDLEPCAPDQEERSWIFPEHVRDGLAAGAPAAVLSSLPSTAHALATGRDPLEAAVAAGTLLLPRERRPGRLLSPPCPSTLPCRSGGRRPWRSCWPDEERSQQGLPAASPSPRSTWAWSGGGCRGSRPCLKPRRSPITSPLASWSALSWRVGVPGATPIPADSHREQRGGQALSAARLRRASGRPA